MNRLFLICACTAFLFLIICCNSRSRGEAGGENGENVQTTDSLATPICVEKPQVNVYIENSGSMDGFVNGTTAFKNAIGKLLAKLKFYYDEENIQIYFIRNDKAQSSRTKETLNVIKCEIDISNFATAIDLKWRADIRNRGNNTDLNNIFKEVLNRTDERTISILCSDCIYSIGNGGVEELLSHEKWTTYDAFLSHSKNNKGNLSTTIVKMMSGFNGKYYPYTGDSNGFAYRGDLPYYICVMANQDILDAFNKNIKLDKGELDGYDNKYVISKGISANPYYSVLMATDNKGRFKQQRNISSLNYVHGIEEINDKPNKRTGEPFSFGIAIDMKNIDVEEDYILNTQNYELTEDVFKVAEVKKVDKNNINANDWQRIKDGNPSHIIILEAKDMHWTNMELGIALKKQVPQWIEGSCILDDTKATYLEEGKSFGLKYWISGIYEAYEEIYPMDKNYFQVIVSIKK